MENTSAKTDILAPHRARLRGVTHERERDQTTRTDTGLPQDSSSCVVPLGALERIRQLFDPGTFTEINAGVLSHCEVNGMGEKKSPGDGVICGFGHIGGRTVYAYSQDRTVFGGSLGAAHAKKISKLMDIAGKSGCPFVGINDSGGARIQEGVEALGGYGEIFMRNVRYSGVIPQLSLLLGPCAGGAAYSPALSDIVIMVDGLSYMFVTGPKVVRAIMGEEIDREKLGGARVHAETSGVAHFLVKSESEGLDVARKVLSYFPPSSRQPAPFVPTQDSSSRSCETLASIVSQKSNQAYEVRTVIEQVLDQGSFLEVQARWAKNVRVGLARLGGYPVGVVANNPAVCAGVLDSDTSRKAARFVRMCNAFGLPLITFVDVPGFMPGSRQEHAGIIDHGAKLAFAYCEATVPKLSVILRKAYGGAYIVMSSKHVGGDFNFAWPNAQIAVVGAAAAVEILHGKELKNHRDAVGLRTKLEAEYNTNYINPTMAEARGFLDAIIQPAETRRVLVRSLTAILGKCEDMPHKRNGNIPL